MRSFFKMHRLISASSKLDSALYGTRDPSTRKSLIKEYYSSVDRVNAAPFFESSFGGCEWFNVKRPLDHQTDLLGRVVVMDFWTYCCINCLHLIPILKNLEEEYSQDKLLVIGVHSGKFDNENVSENVNRAVQRYAIPHPVINDIQRRIWKAFSVSCWPSLLILDTQLQIVKVLTGEVPLATIREFVDPLLPSSPAPSKLPILPSASPLGPLYYPGKVQSYNDKKYLAVSDTGNHRILLIDPATKTVLRIIGTGLRGFEDGKLDSCSFSSPQGVAFLNESSFYVADVENHAIRFVDLEKNTVSTVAGDGTRGEDVSGGKSGNSQPLASPWDLCIGPDPEGSGSVLYVAMAGTHQIWAHSITPTIWWKGVKRDKGLSFNVFGTGNEENRNNDYPNKSAFAQPSGIDLSKDRSYLYVADSESSTVRRLDIKKGTVKNICGGTIDPMNLFDFGDVDGHGMSAKLQHPIGLAVDDKNVLWITDTYNHKLKIIHEPTVKNPEVKSLKTPSVLDEPSGITFAKNSDIYVADTNNHRILKFESPYDKYSILTFTFPDDPDSTSDKIINTKFSSGSAEQKIVFNSSKTIKEIRVLNHSDYKVEKSGALILNLPVSKSKIVVSVMVGTVDCDGDTCWLQKIRYNLEFESADDSLPMEEKIIEM